MVMYQCECGKLYKTQQGLSVHGNKSKKTVNNGNGCSVYQQRKKEGKCLNVAKNDKKNNDNIEHKTITDLKEKIKNMEEKSKYNDSIGDKKTITELKEKIKIMEKKTKNNDNFEDKKTIYDLEEKIKNMEDVNKKFIVVENKNNKKDKMIEDLQTENEKLKKQLSVNINNGSIVNNNNTNINIHINNATEESTESFLLNLNSIIQKTIYNNFKVFIPGQGEIKDYNEPQLSNYKGHLYLADALYNDKNHPENRTYYYDREKQKLFIRKDDRWVTKPIEIHVIDIKKNIYNKLGPVIFPFRIEFEDEVSDIHNLARDNFASQFNQRQQTLFIDILDLYKKDKPTDNENDDNYDSYSLNKWTIMNNEYLNWIRQ